MRKQKPDPTLSLLELVEQLLQGTATEAQLEQLRESLRTSSEARRFYLHYMNLHSALRRRFAFAVEDEAATDDSSREAQSRPKTQRAVRRLWIGAGVVALMILAALVFLLRDTPNLATIAEVSGAVEWTGAGGQVVTSLTPGTTLDGGTLELLSADAWVKLVFPDRSTVTVLGRSTLTIAADHGIRIRLGEGRMAASVSPQPRSHPMLVDTPTARLEVLGTQFDIEVEKAATTLRVNQGRVRITRLADGRVAEVPADHQVVVPASRSNALKVVPRPGPVHVWRSNLPCGAAYGQWLSPGQPGCSRLEAAPILLDYPEQPVTVYLAAGSFSRGPAPPIVLAPGARLRLRLWLRTSADVYFGLTMKHLKGGFAGKYIAHRRLQAASPRDQPMEIELRGEDFRPQEEEFPHSPLGLELVDWWCFTYNVDAGLGITSVELLPLGAIAASPPPLSDPHPSPILDLWTAAFQGNLEAIKRHIAAGAEINAPFIAPGIPASGATPLHLAVLADQREVVQYLVEQGADLKAKAKDTHGGTPLHWAAALGRVEMARLLIEAGADVNALDNHGFTPLDATRYDQHASTLARAAVAKLLRQHEALSGQQIQHQDLQTPKQL